MKEVRSIPEAEGQLADSRHITYIPLYVIPYTAITLSNSTSVLALSFKCSSIANAKPLYVEFLHLYRYTYIHWYALTPEMPTEVEEVRAVHSAISMT